MSRADSQPTHRASPCVACVALGSGAAARRASTINIPFERYTLPNGLTVILSQDHSTPTVAVNVWYHVGSKNEAPGRTGFAHLFEHVMFTGSGHVPYGLHDKLTEGVGGSNNGTTSNDRTTYYETVPSNYLESALWLEADRMGFLLDTLDIAKLERAARHRQERAAPELRQPALRPRRRDPRRGDLPGLASLLVGRDRQHGGSLGRVGSRRQELLPSVLRTEQRVPLDRRRLRSGAGQGVGHEVLRRPAAGRRDHAPEGRAGHAGRCRSGWSTRIASRCRGCTCSGRRSARRATTSTRSTCSARSSPARGRRA